MTLYDEVEYPSRSFNQTHPERAATIGTLLGMSPPTPATCRVLEVGCGSGWNLIPMAAAVPRAQIFGFDLAASAIDAARRDTAALGLSNLRFECLDLLEFPKDLGPFDYIIAHGFYSWVPAPVRLRLLELCREQLTPQGLAFISFNAKPYATLRLMWREMMQYHSDLTGATSPADRVTQSQAFLKILQSQWTRNKRTTAHAKLLDVQIAAFENAGGHWFFHDDLGPIFDSFSIAEFSRQLEPHGLQFAAEAMFDNLFAEQQETADWIAWEQSRDSIAFRGFRNVLICHRDQVLGRPPDPARFERTSFAAPLTRVSQAVFRNDWNAAEAESTDAETIAVLERLGKAWPSSVSYNDLGATPAMLQDFTLSNVIEPCLTPRQLPMPAWRITATPVAWASARLQAERGQIVTNRLHGAVQLDQEPLRQLLLGLDGTRALAEFQHLFPSQQVLLEQVAWLHREALIQG